MVKKQRQIQEGAGGYRTSSNRTKAKRLESGDHLYIDYVAGAGTTKLSPAYIERALKVAGTARNWNTARKLLEIATL